MISEASICGYSSHSRVPRRPSRVPAADVRTCHCARVEGWTWGRQRSWTCLQCPSPGV